MSGVRPAWFTTCGSAGFAQWRTAYEYIDCRRVNNYGSGRDMCSKTHTAVVDDAHVENGVAERILKIRIRTVLNQQIVDVLVGEAGSERQRVLTVIGIAWNTLLF